MLELMELQATSMRCPNAPSDRVSRLAWSLKLVSRRMCGFQVAALPEGAVPSRRLEAMVQDSGEEGVAQKPCAEMAPGIACVPLAAPHQPPARVFKAIGCDHLHVEVLTEAAKPSARARAEVVPRGCGV